MTGAPFQPGDVVVCVDDRRLGSEDAEMERYRTQLRRGAPYRVAEAGLNWCTIREIETPFPYAWHAKRFRKIDDEVTDAFREQLRTLKTHSPVLSSQSGTGSGPVVAHHATGPQSLGEGA